MNYKLTISYDGTEFDGWQKHPGKKTVQGKLEEVAENYNGYPTEVVGAGRTDRGVHALHQVANVRLSGGAKPENVLRYFNRYLPGSIKIESADAADDRFHARFACMEKTYSYSVWTGEKAPVFMRKYVYCYGKKPDIELMKEAASDFIGTHDFGCFARKTPEKKSTVRTLKKIDITEKGELIGFYFTGDGFLYNQVRIMTGTLLEIGTGSKNKDCIKQAFETGDRSQAGFTAPPEGLCLTDIKY